MTESSAVLCEPRALQALLELCAEDGNIFVTSFLGLPDAGPAALEPLEYHGFVVRDRDAYELTEPLASSMHVLTRAVRAISVVVEDTFGCVLLGDGREWVQLVVQPGMLGILPPVETEQRQALLRLLMGLSESLPLPVDLNVELAGGGRVESRDMTVHSTQEWEMNGRTGAPQEIVDMIWTQDKEPTSAD